MVILPHLIVFYYLKLNITSIYKHITVDKFGYCGILKRTLINSGAHNVIAVRTNTEKGIFPQRRRCAQCISGKSQSLWFPGRRVFRSSRHCPSQIRNVTPRACGKRGGDKSGRGIWIISQYLLSGQFKFRRSRNKRPYSRKTWPSRSSQSQFQNTLLSQRLYARGKTHPGAQASDAGATRIWHHHPPQDNRTCTGWKKNGVVKPDITTTSETKILTDKVCLSRRYEKLRKAALGEAVPVEDRSGLVLFLRHGMIRWIKTISEAESSQKQQINPCSRSTGYVTSIQNNTVIKIFAAMALHTQNKGERTT